MKSSYVIRRPVFNAYLVRQKDRRRRRELVGVLALALVLGGCLVSYVWVHVELLRTGYRVDKLESELEAGRRLERELLLEANYLARPARIESRAAEELQMRVPELEQLVFEAELFAAEQGSGPTG